MPTVRCLIKRPVPWSLWFSTGSQRHYATSYMFERNPQLDIDLIDSLQFSAHLQPAGSCHELILSGKDAFRILDAVPDCFSADQPSRNYSPAVSRKSSVSITWYEALPIVSATTSTSATSAASSESKITTAISEHSVEETKRTVVAAADSPQTTATPAPPTSSVSIPSEPSPSLQPAQPAGPSSAVSEAFAASATTQPTDKWTVVTAKNKRKKRKNKKPKPKSQPVSYPAITAESLLHFTHDQLQMALAETDKEYGSDLWLLVQDEYYRRNPVTYPAITAESLLHFTHDQLQQAYAQTDFESPLFDLIEAEVDRRSG